MRIDLKPETREFLASWLDWVEGGAEYADPFHRSHGLCSSAAIYDRLRDPEGEGLVCYRDLYDTFRRVYGRNYLYPFGENAYDRAMYTSTQHLDPKRLAFVRANLPEGDPRYVG